MLAHLLIDLLELCDLAGFGGRRLGPGHLFVAGTYGLKRGALAAAGAGARCKSRGAGEK